MSTSALLLLLLTSCVANPAKLQLVGPGAAAAATRFAPIEIGASFTIESRELHEARRINVFVPSVYGEEIDAALPVLYMPDGGIDEDFLHLAGLLQVLVSNGGMRPFMLVGIANTQRRRDLTGPTSSDEDRKIAPAVGGSAPFRQFIRNELMPTVRSTFRTTDEAAIIGESLAGLFVIETLLLEPDLFSTYIAIDPSLWWDHEGLLRQAEMEAKSGRRRVLFVANSAEPELGRLCVKLKNTLETSQRTELVIHHAPLTEETHATIYHPAALKAFRTVLGPGSVGN